MQHPLYATFEREKLLRRRTPFLLMSRRMLRERSAEFTAFSPRVQTLYSVKANPAPQVLSFFMGLDIGYEVSSLAELRQVLSLGVPAEEVSTSNPVKSPEFIRYAYRRGLREYVLDSSEEVRKLARYAPGSGVLVRLAVDNTESAWPLDEKYGVEPAEAAELLLDARDRGLQPQGATFHVGSQCTGLTSWRSALEKAAEVWRRSAAEGIALSTLNVGGGFAAHHTAEVPTVTESMETIVSCADELFPPGTELHAEPGRGLVGDAGVLVASVIGTARRGSQDWVYLDVGVFNGLTETVGGLGYSIVPVNGGAQGPERPWVVAGPTCDSFDVVSRETLLPELSAGDRVAIAPAGAYTTSYASRFNGASIPKTYLD